MNYLNILTNVLLGKKNRITNAIGYLDTGNTLKCSLTGRHVSIATYPVAAALATTEMLPVIDKYVNDPSSICRYQKTFPKGLHLIPYNTICSKGQIMLAMDADYMFIDTRYIEKNPLIGISPNIFTILRTDKCILLNKNNMKRGQRHVKHNKG